VASDSKKPTNIAFWRMLIRDAGIFPEAKLRETVQEAQELVAVRKGKGLLLAF
jgi:hypothetical protein